MTRFDRYMLSQLMVLFGFFSLILVMVYWVNRAILLFDQLIADGQSATVFLELTALVLPNVIRLVLPLSAFASVVYVTNRLSSESELVVMQATGYSGARLARPVFLFGTFVALLMSILTHYLVPLSITQLSVRNAQIAENITARLLTEGTFLHPAPGITFYIREITPQGELQGVFLSDARDETEQVTYTAKSALLIRGEEGPKLVMFDGLAQTLQSDGQRLFTTSFADFAYDVGSLIAPTPSKGPRVEELGTMSLLFPTEADLEETRRDAGVLVQEGHGRISQALLCIVAAMIGFSTLLLGGFSRFGVWRQIVFAITLLILVKLVESAVTEPVRNDAALWPLVYLPAALGFAISGVMLWMAGKPALFRRRRAVG